MELTGTATTDGESRSRVINVTVIPSAKDEGALKVSFMAGGKKTVFDTSYQVVRHDSLRASRD